MLVIIYSKLLILAVRQKDTKSYKTSQRFQKVMGSYEKLFWGWAVGGGRFKDQWESMILEPKKSY